MKTVKHKTKFTSSTLVYPETVTRIDSVEGSDFRVSGVIVELPYTLQPGERIELYGECEVIGESVDGLPWANAEAFETLDTAEEPEPSSNETPPAFTADETAERCAVCGAALPPRR